MNAGRFLLFALAGALFFGSPSAEACGGFDGCWEDHAYDYGYDYGYSYSSVSVSVSVSVGTHGGFGGFGGFAGGFSSYCYSSYCYRRPVCRTCRMPVRRFGRFIARSAGRAGRFLARAAFAPVRVAAFGVRGFRRGVHRRMARRAHRRMCRRCRF